jgi:predicted PurR-regulated permease PerM
MNRGTHVAHTHDTITTTRRRFYLTFTVIGITLIVVAALWVIGQIWTPISIILFSAFLVFVLHTPVAFLERKGVPRILGAVIMYIVAILVIAAIALVFIPVIMEQFVSFVGMLPQYIQDASNYFSQAFSQISSILQESGIQDVVSTIGSEMAKWASSMASDSANAVVTTASTISTFFLVAGVSLVVGFWILIDLPRFSAEVYKIVGPRYTEDVHVIAAAFSRSLGGYLRGMVVSCLCTGTLAFIAYTAIGLPYPAVMALFTGLMVFVPFIGPAVAWILAGIIGLFVSPLTGILALVLTIVAQMLNDNLIYPRVMGGSVELHPAVILVVIFVGAALGGIFGMLCAVPLTSAVKAIFVYYFEKTTGRQLISEDGALFKGHPSSDVNPEVDSLRKGLPTRLLQMLLGGKKVPGSTAGTPEKTADPTGEAATTDTWDSAATESATATGSKEAKDAKDAAPIQTDPPKQT